MNTIEDWTFTGCTSLEWVRLPDNITRIRRGSFEDCTALTEVDIPHSVTEFNLDAFKGCTCTVTYKGKKFSLSDK